MPLALPLGALVTGLFLVAVPVTILMAVWAAVTVVRILFPERPLPLEAAARRERAVRRGDAVPVRLRDILEDQALRHAAAASGAEGETTAPPHPFAEDLWLRRN